MLLPDTLGKFFSFRIMRTNIEKTVPTLKKPSSDLFLEKIILNTVK